MLKRMFLEKGAHVRLAAAREAWFGAALGGHFVESFATARGDVWLVFEHAGRVCMIICSRRTRRSGY